jgi:hypothetical protein
MQCRGKLVAHPNDDAVIYKRPTSTKHIVSPTSEAPVSGKAVAEYVEEAAATAIPQKLLDMAEMTFATEEYVDAAITTAVSPLATDEYVDATITTAISPFATETYVDGAITTAVGPLATETYVDTAITTAITPLTTKTYVDGAITTAVSPLTTKTYVDSAISTAVTPLATKVYVDAAIVATKKTPVKYSGAACFVSLTNDTLDAISSQVVVSDDIVSGSFILNSKLTTSITAIDPAFTLASTIPAPFHKVSFSICVMLPSSYPIKTFKCPEMDRSEGQEKRLH